MKASLMCWPASVRPMQVSRSLFLRPPQGVAREKAGIMKAHTPVIIGPQSDLVRAVLDAEANKTRAEAKFWGADFRAYRQHGRLVFEDNGQLLDLPLPALIGDHQVMNAGTAIAVACRT